MTRYQIRERQRLLSDETRQTHDPLARAGWAEVERQQRRRWRRVVLLVVAVVVALAFTIGLVIVGGAQVTLQRGQ